MNIRAETHTDSRAIEELTYKAFENHPHHAPGAKPTEHEIVNRLRDSGALTLSLVAEDETGIVGHIALSPVAIDNAVSNWYGLGPVSVAPERQREGIGGQLIKKVIEQIRKQGAEGIVLLGDPEYYRRFGFESHGNLTLPGVPCEYFMVQSLRADEVAIPKGEVSYHQAFNE
ncbi:N-acetyltransferase [Vibrio sp. ZSDZ34]|jgi:putative acetyltransferase|uniref:N-acetyltransferase n=1 Tax=Vibrio gelatinilyticus TaxID=2893468 RepID=A0A9X1W6R5_9VIBR|nr:N-acetyltransferase [Vibrio gelatinilyticus]MCJ2375527.1 N-acetyltransferase [Vibrio gelatinilyticus]